MLNKLSIYRIFWGLWFFLLIAKIELVVNSVYFFLFTFWELVFSSEATLKFNLQVADLLVSILLLVFLPILVYWLKRKSKIFNTKIGFSSFTFLLLIFALLFAPIISSFHPNAQLSVRASRFLNPLSTITILRLKGIASNSEYLKLRDEVIKSSVNSNKIFVNSFKKDGQNIYYRQGNKVSKIALNKLITKEEEPAITKKILLFGTDELGRDIFSRIIYGARVSLFIAFFSVVISLLIGLLLGYAATSIGGIFNLILSRITDMFLTIPSIFFVIMILAFWGNSIFAVIMVLGLTGWMNLFKIVKGEVSSVIKKDYYLTSKKIGLSSWELLTKEILPILATQLIIFSVFQFSNVILAEASLSYLGLGVGLNYPSWGNMILSGQKYMSSGAWLIIIPSIILVLSILVINDFGEKIKNIMNPRISNDKQ